METFELLPRKIDPAELLPGKRTITVHADQSAGECYRFWTVGNFNRPHMFLDPQRRRSIAQRMPFVKEANLVYLLGGRLEEHNCWYLGVATDGSVRADFSGMIDQLRAVQEAGYVPRIVLDNIPFNMSDPPQRNTYGNTAPPTDERFWHQYVQAAVQAMVDAFGRQTVGSWWFRVGTEPDLKPEHWAGTKEQYFAHYDFTVDAVTRVLPDAHIGPGNILNPLENDYRIFDRDLWGLDIIDHAATGRNACTGARGARMTWFSWSWYGFVGVPISNFDRVVARVRERLARYPQFARVVLGIGEFAVLGDENGRRVYTGETTEWSASFYAALADRVYGYGIRTMYEWAETTQGLYHPRAQTIAMLDRMAGGQRLAVQVEGGSAASCGAVACRKGEDVLLLVYHHRDLRRPRVNETVHLVLRDPRLSAGTSWRLSEWTIDETHGVWAYAFQADCEAAGLTPVPGAALFEGSVHDLFGEPGLELLRKNFDRYAALAVMPQTKDSVAVPAGQGQLALDLEMPSHSVRLMQLSPAR